MPIAEIEIHAGTNSRPIHSETVAEYAKLWREGVQFPPVDVFDDGQKLYAADGFHRREAAEEAGQTEIKAKVHKGTRLDAFRFSLGANQGHGLRPTRSDKRYAVDRTLSEFPDHSDRQLAEMCGVSPTFVGNRRRRLPTVHVDSSRTSPTRLGRDGKQRKMPKRQSARSDKTGASASSDAAHARETAEAPSTGSKQGEPNSKPEEAINRDAQTKSGKKKPAEGAFDIEKCLERILVTMYQEVRNCTQEQAVDLHRRVTFAATHLFTWPGTINDLADLVKIAQQGEEYYQTTVTKRGAASTQGDSQQRSIQPDPRDKE